MASPRLANPLALAVLACLYERPMHPYEVATTLRTRAKHDSIKLNYGSLYTVVDTLQRLGLIVPKETERDGRRPERTVYRIGEAGRQRLIEWMSELVGTPAKEYSRFEAGLSLMPVLPPETVVELLEGRARRLETELAAHRELVAQIDIPRLFRVEADYGFALKQAELTFIRALASEIGTGTLDGLSLWREFQATHPAPADDPRAPGLPAAHPTSAPPVPEE